jgi:hypothetical protein
MGGGKYMTRSLLTTCFLSLAFAAVGAAQGTTSPSGNGAHYTQAQLKQLVLNAHAPAQYAALASYYNERQNNYLQKAAEEKEEWARLGQNITSVAAKYPRPVDSARNLYEYYIYKASEAGEFAEKYRRLAATNTP